MKKQTASSGFQAKSKSEAIDMISLRSIEAPEDTSDSDVFIDEGNDSMDLNDQETTPVLSPPQHLQIEDRDSDSGQDLPFMKLIFFKVVYFFNGLSSSTWGRFGVIYYNQVKHMSPMQIGTLCSAVPIISFVTQPFWGVVADRIHSRKNVYVVCKVMSTCCLLALSLSAVDTFEKVLTCVAGTAMFSSGGVLDAHTMDFLGEKNRGLYGTIRVWTAISWGLGAVLMGYITDHFGFYVNFWLYGTMSFGVLFFVWFGLSSRSSSEQARYDDSCTSHPRLEQLRRALLKLPVVFWLVEVALVGASMSLVDNFLFVYLQNDLQASTVLCGWTVGVTVLFELPIFWSSKFLLQKVGHDGLFLTSLLAYSTRVFGYTLLRPSTIYWVFPLEVLHGITFACAVVASVDYSTAISPKEWSTTVQSILSTVMSCVGGGLGPILGGIVANEYGFVVLYRGAGYVTAAASLVHVGLWMCGMGHGAFLERLAKEAGPKDEHVYVGIKKLVSPNASLYMCIISISILKFKTRLL